MNDKTESDDSASRPLDFIREMVADDVAKGRNEGRVVTRFPPEPNGYLHIGHAKAICIDFGIAREFGGHCNLRFDDTNPLREEQRYIDSIMEDVRWLGFSWKGPERYASDYFGQLHDWAVHLIEAGKAYVDDQAADEIRENRGTLTEPGKNSPFRDRPVDENLDLFRRMKEGEFPDGARVLRAKIDMAAANLNLRDPVIYRIMHTEHPKTGDAWCIYPMYDWAHGQSDAIEGVTHSLCDIDFENHRPLYDWFIENLPVPHRPRQTEFARGNITHMITSKRKLLRLIEGGHVSGWDDPRMPTLKGLRRRGYTPGAIRAFWEEVGVAKRENLVEIALLEHKLRDELNRTSERRMAVLDPLKIVLTNYPVNQVEEFDALNNPEDAAAGTRKVPFSRELFIERDDFMEDPPRKFYRLAPGREVRLRWAYLITCDEAVKDERGEITELRCTYDPATKGGDAPDGRRVKATLHWVSAKHAARAEVRLYNHLFLSEDPEADGDFVADLNPDSVKVVPEAMVEPTLADANPGDRVQFERLGYFCADTDSTKDHLVFNRTVTLRDSWTRARKQQKQKQKQKKGRRGPG